MTDRPETGAMSFGDDWPGVFIRGDEAHEMEQFARMAAEALEASDCSGLSSWVDRIADVLNEARESKDPQIMRPFDECRARWTEEDIERGKAWGEEIGALFKECDE